MKIIHDRLLRYFFGLFDFKFLLQRQPCLPVGDVEHSSLHQRVQHALLDASITRCNGASVEEEYGRLLCAVVCVLVSVECESGLGAGNRVGQLSDG